MGYVAFRFKIGESGNFSFGCHRKSPKRILPDLDPTEFCIARRTATENAGSLWGVHLQGHPSAA